MRFFVFDLDGTLVDSHSPYFETMSKVYSHFNIKFTESDMQDLLRISSKDRADFFAKRLGSENLKKSYELFELYSKNDLHTVKKFSEIEKVLNQLKKKNIGLAVWTAREADSADDVLKHTHLYSYFEHFMTSSSVENCKPHPEGLIKLADKFNCKPSDMVMVGDHDNDVSAAAACGARGVRAHWHKPADGFKCKLAAHQFDELAHFSQWIEDFVR